jgi:tetratricopeptide (TPR) repeat protein
MKNELDIQQLLDDYLEQRLTRNEASVLLNEQGVENAETEIDLHHAAAICLQRYNILKQVQNVHSNFLQEQASINETIPDQKVKVVRMNAIKWVMSIAATIVVILSVWFFTNTSTVSSSALYAEIYQPYSVNTDRSNIVEIVPHNMIQEFKDKNYAAVIKTYQGLVVTNNREKFLTAIAYQETGAITEAINLLNQLLLFNKQQNNRLYNDEAEFYLALNYLKIQKTAEAIPLFQKIYDDPGHTFHERITKTTMRNLKKSR